MCLSHSPTTPPLSKQRGTRAPLLPRYARCCLHPPAGLAALGNLFTPSSWINIGNGGLLGGISGGAAGGIASLNDLVGIIAGWVCMGVRRTPCHVASMWHPTQRQSHGP